LPTAVVTGASRGIGADIARVLRREGWDLVINYVRAEAQAEALCRELGCRSVRADISRPEEARRLIAAAGRVELLVCCAGIAWSGLLTDMSPEDWRRLMAVNLDGVFNCCRAAIPGMVREKSGSIITVSSVWGVHGASCEAAYSASKAGIIGLTLSLAKELGPSGVRVNCIAPGVIDTDMLAGYSPEEKRELAERTPLGRLGAGRDVAELAAFLASDRAGFITGQVIGCDGGFGL